MLPTVNPAPAILPVKKLLLPPAIILASKYPLLPTCHPDPGLVISTDVTSAPETTTVAKVPFQVVSFWVV